MSTAELIVLSSFRGKLPTRIVTRVIGGEVDRADAPFCLPEGERNCVAVFVRNDGWTLGVRSLSDYLAAKSMWASSWVGVIHKSGRMYYF